MEAKLGPEAATVATAHKIAVIFYTMVKNQVEYDETLRVMQVWGEKTLIVRIGICQVRNGNHSRQLLA
jgi:hypothetical protein